MKKVRLLLLLLIVGITFSSPKLIKAEEYPIENETEPGTEDDGFVPYWYTDEATGYRYYYVAEGVLCTGFKEIDGDIYYFNNEGIARKGWVTYNSKKFYFNAENKMCTGMTKVGKDTYFFATTGELGNIGAAKGGWKTVNKYCYYFDKKNFKLQKSAKKGEFVMADGYKVDYLGRSKTRYDVLLLVKAHTKPGMTNEEKIESMFQWLIKNDWTYTRTYEHTKPDWEWYTGWTDDFASQIMENNSGNCFRYSSLFGYMVKEATGYYTRVYHGMTPSTRGRLTPHGWVLVKKEDGLWYAYDPDMDKFYKHRDMYYNTLYSETKKKLHQKGEYVSLR